MQAMRRSWPDRRSSCGTYTPGAMRGILSAGGYIPHGRLDRSAIAPFVGAGGGRGSRSVASYDEDTTTMGFEAARLALRAAADSPRPDMVWFSTVTPAYLDKTNATAIHAALRLDDDVAALDLGGAQRSAVGALRIALAGNDTVLVVAADMRTGRAAAGAGARARPAGGRGAGRGGGGAAARRRGRARPAPGARRRRPRARRRRGGGRPWGGGRGRRRGGE